MAGVWKQRTGHPVIMIVVVKAATEAEKTLKIEVAKNDMKCVGCILGTRNNEMIDLIAKYFL
jgi:hypothetical protein